ncbi:PREDICTED: lisH domain and HEAT repeat-containing protein KIAA1468 homolog isoform X2 [Lupinus angustifolius]|uniref:lisH domain and HEAT repeat-containing protein KIAA1468 homolog isoform X2 n=1 Tax=Lupinus angustifolius TaxID=3871 RepID=UPI00092E498B|nr:PREDICTED: lisH domain and HEAT repeat-containing protein KIAA1468 homolog isoform X2 [Lupinus angustifolius]
MEKYSSVCNLVVKFLLEENYLLTAFELLHELVDNGHHIHAIRLQQYFSNPNLFPPDLISGFNSLPLADPQTLLHEKEAAEEKFAITNYELRLAQEDILKLQAQLHTKTEYLIKTNGDVSVNNNVVQSEEQKMNSSFNDLGPIKENERLHLNCAVKEYLLMAGYNLTAMTFYEEVTNHQNMDIWKNNNTNTLTPDALRHYYYHYLSSTSELAQEKVALIRDNEKLLKENENLNEQKEKLIEENKRLLKDKELEDGQRSLEELHKDLKNKGNMVQALKQSLENQTKELNACRSEINKLKMHISQSESLTKYKEEIKNLQMEIEWLKEKNIEAPVSRNFDGSENEIVQTEDKAIVIHEDKGAISYPIDTALDDKADAQSHFEQTLNDYADKHEDTLHALSNPANANSTFENIENVYEQNVGKQEEDESIYDKTGLGTIQILADTLPKIVPYVLINHREELLPLMMCAIECHPDSRTRDSLTHTLFNLIKRPDENQRRIIMDACVTLAKNVGEMRTEIELLPQCWEQINHMYEERRLLVAQSCGELAEFVRPEIRDSLILSIVHQLIEDSATVVREAATHNLAMLLPLFLNTDKYFKVEELMFQLLCDPSGVVVETTLKELVPAVIKWGNKLDNVLRVLLSHIISSAKSCPPLSGVEGDIESHLHALGERERWNIDVLLRMLVELVPLVHQKAIETCPFQSTTETTQKVVFSTSLLELYARGDVKWDAFEWMHVECFPKLIQLACLLPGKEDNLRTRISKFLLSVSEKFGDSYITCIMLPVFFTALGNDADFTFFPSAIHSRIKGLRPRSGIGEGVSTLCVLPLVLAGVLGGPEQGKQLTEYMRMLLLEGNVKENPSFNHTSHIINAVRFICIYEENHSMVFNILWEMVVSSNVNLKINAAKLLKVIVPYIDPKVVSTNALPALITLGSEQNVSVKCASIDAFGAVALHFKNEMIVDKIRVQMSGFLEDGSDEVTIAVIHALVVTVPHTTQQLRDYLLSKISQLTAIPTPSSIDLMHRRDRANAFCEAIRALDATDLPANSVRDMLLPAIQNLLKDLDALDPAQKEALEIIMKERSRSSFESVNNNYKAKGAHRNSFSEGNLHAKKDNIEQTSSETVVSPKDTRFRRIMLGHFGKVKGKSHQQTQN